MVSTSEQASDRALNEAVQRLVDALHPERIYLFGSQARGDATEESDYDLLIVVPGSGKLPHSRAVEAYAAVATVPIAVDLLIWTRQAFERQLPVVASVPATVIREGRLLYAA